MIGRTTVALGGLIVAVGGALALGAASASPAVAAATATLSAAATTACTPSDVVVVSHNSELTTASVKLAAGSAGVSCDVSLHSYETQGATWQTSGTQKFLGFDSVHLTISPQTLSVPAALCFGQTELVIGTTRYDGVDGPLPHYPNGVFPPSTVIAVRHYSKPCGSVSPSPSVSPSASVLPTATATETATPQASLTPSPSPSVLGITFTKPPQGGPLPFTGAPVGPEIAVGLGLVCAGLLLFAARLWLRRGLR